MVFLLPVIIAFISFLLQSYPRLFNKYFGVDVWTRLLEVNQVRNNGHRIPSKKLSQQFIIDGFFDYPPIFPILLSFISKDKLLSLQGFVAPFFDSLQVLLVFITAFFITHNVPLSLFAEFIYILTPIIAIENSYLTPRSLGYLMFNLTLLMTINYFYNQNYVSFFISVLLSAILFLTHRFALQSFVLISIFFTFYLKTPLFLIILLLGFCLALLATKGYYFRVLEGHFYNIYFWWRNLNYRFSHQVRGVLKKDIKLDWVEKIYKLLSVFSPIALFSLSPWSISTFVVAIISFMKIIPIAPVFVTFTVWIIFFYIVSILVLKIKYLMPIGEGQRYMEMVAVPSAILYAYIFFELLLNMLRPVAIALTVFILVSSFSVILFVQIKGVIKDANRSVNQDWLKMFDYINKQGNDIHLICIPHQNTTMVLYHTKAYVLVNADNKGLLQLNGIYPILTIPLENLAKKYHLTHVLIKDSFVSLKELHLENNKIEYSSSDIHLVNIN